MLTPPKQRVVTLDEIHKTQRLRALQTRQYQFSILKLSASRDIEADLKALKDDTRVKELDLSYMHLQDTDMLLVKEMLEENRTIETINLAFNNLGDQGALHLAEGLKSNTTLTQLSLKGNSKISMAGGRAIMEALYTNTKPEAIELRIYTPEKTDQMRGVIWQELIGDKPVNLKLKAFKKRDEQDGMATQTPPLTPARKALQFSPPRHPQPYVRTEKKRIMPQALLPTPVRTQKHTSSS